MTFPKQQPMKLGEYYTLAGAAQALGLSYWAVYRYVRIAGIPVTKLGHQKLVKLEDLRELGMPQDPTPGRRDAGGTSEETAARGWGKRCPECGANALVYEEGCQKCYVCGYSAC